MKPVRVLGIGSPFGDDQIGWEVVRLLQQKNSLQAFEDGSLELLISDRPGLRLLELMQDASLVYLIDAMQTGLEPGMVHRFHQEELLQLPRGLSSHALGISESLEIGSVLGLLPETIILYGIEMQPNQVQGGLSSVGRDAVTELADTLTREIMQWFLSKTFEQYR